MKTILIGVATIAFSTSAAFSECIACEKLNASISVDREFKTASISPPTEPAQKPVLVLQKTNRLAPVAAPAEVTMASPQSALERMQ